MRTGGLRLIEAEAENEQLGTKGRQEFRRNMRLAVAESQFGMSVHIAKTLMTVGAVTLCIAVILLVVVPNLPRARSNISRNPCINILRSLDGATETWALDNGKTTNDIPTWDDIRPYLSRDGKIPSCPQGGKYALGRKGTLPTCTYPGHRLP